MQVGTTLMDGFRVVFSIEQTDRPEPNSSEISIYNLSEDFRGRIQDRDLPVVLEAGYGNDISQVFSGQMRRDGISTRRDGPNWITTFKSLDGGDAFRNSRIQESFAAGTKLRPVLEKLARSMGVGIGNSIAKISEGDAIGTLTEFTEGTVLSGKTSSEFDRLLRSIGYDFSIQDGKLQVARLGQSTEKTAVLLSPGTGLVGSPEPGAKGLTKIKSLLQPVIRPRRLVRLETNQLSGFYICRKVKHTGDTDGPAWYSEIEATQR